MTTTPLDLIAARHDRLSASYKDGCSCCKPAEAHIDRGALIQALRAVETVAAYWDTLADGDRYYARVVRAAIREALEA